MTLPRDGAWLRMGGVVQVARRSAAIRRRRPAPRDPDGSARRGSWPVLAGELESESRRGAMFCLGLSDLDEADGPVEGERVLVTGDGDRAKARAAGDARRVMDQLAGDSLAAPPWVDEQVLKIWLTIRTGGQRGEAHGVVAAVHDGDCHSGATLGDAVSGEERVVGTGQQRRRVPGV